MTDEWLEWVTKCAEVGKQIGAYPVERWVLEEGRIFTQSRVDADVLPIETRPKACFYNVMMLIKRRPELTYCEGVAASVFPIHHAWAIDNHDVVIDPTWQDRARSDWYYGVPIRRAVVLRQFKKMLVDGMMTCLFGPELRKTWTQCPLTPKQSTKRRFERSTRKASR